MKYQPYQSDETNISADLSPRTLKEAARARMREGYPEGISKVLKIALVYILLTDWVSQVINILPTNPLNALADQMLNALNSGSSEAINAVYANAPALFSPPAARITLFFAILVGLYTIVMNFSYSGYAMGLHRGGQPGYGSLFSRFHLAGKIILLSLLMAVCIYLWSLLFLIPGLIALYRYRMSRYLLLDNPHQGVFAAWQQSKRMMRGHKWELFLLDLSFLPLILLAAVVVYGAEYLLTLVGTPQLVSYWLPLALSTAFYVYLTPYIELATVGFYEQLKTMPQR